MNENMNEKLFYEFLENGEWIEKCNYGYSTDQVAFNTGSDPATVHLIKYNEKYAVCIMGEMDSDGNCFDEYLPENHYGYIEELSKVYSTYEEAYAVFKSLEDEGLPSGEKQIAECLSKVTDSKSITIVPYYEPYCIKYDVYYREHSILKGLCSLDPNVINTAIEKELENRNKVK